MKFKKLTFLNKHIESEHLSENSQGVFENPDDLFDDTDDFFDDTGISFSEALILASTNPQYDERLFIEFRNEHKFRTCCVQKLLFCFCIDVQNNFVHNMF